MDNSMIKQQAGAHGEAPQGVSRRNLLRGSITLGLVAMAGGMLPWQAAMAASADRDFAELSAFLVSRPVNPVLASRYYAALARRAPNFQANVTALKQLIKDQGFGHVDEYLAMASPDPSLKATAASIVSAWYLGIVGELADAELISFSEALMYQPTHGILIIPTYGGGPASWGSKPVQIQESGV